MGLSTPMYGALLGVLPPMNGVFGPGVEALLRTSL